MGNNRLGSNSDIEKLARQARKKGFDVYVVRSNHIEWLAPPNEDGVREFIRSPLTPGDPRRIKAIHKFLRTHGCPVNH